MIFLVGCCGLDKPRFCVPTVYEAARGRASINSESPVFGVMGRNLWWYTLLPLAIPVDIISVTLLLGTMPISGQILDAVR